MEPFENQGEETSENGGLVSVKVLKWGRRFTFSKNSRRPVELKL